MPIDSRRKMRYHYKGYAAVVELADTRDLKSLGSNTVPVQARSEAPYRVFITDLTVTDTRFSFSASLLAETEFVHTNSLLVTV